MARITTPPQPSRIERTIICDNLPVGSAYAAADALVWEVMNDIERIIRRWSPGPPREVFATGGMLDWRTFLGQDL